MGFGLCWAINKIGRVAERWAVLGKQKRRLVRLVYYLIFPFLTSWYVGSIQANGLYYFGFYSCPFLRLVAGAAKSVAQNGVCGVGKRNLQEVYTWG